MDRTTKGVLLVVAYDGHEFSGWAPQANARTVGGELQGAINAIDPYATRLRAASRTDAGVHARAQLSSFDTSRNIDPRGWALALAQHLPPAVVVVGVAPVPKGYDPRAHVHCKCYRYLVLRSPIADPFLARRAWRVGYRLNQQKMERELRLVVGRHDFAAFRSAADTRTDTVRQILRAQVRNSGSDPRCLEMEIEGDRFLHNMVRIVVGTIIDVGRGQLAEGAVLRAISSGNRADLGMTAPPDGLYLERVELTSPVYQVWPPQQTITPNSRML
jgi:tRNA pseudouridine38-40 synthase